MPTPRGSRQPSALPSSLASGLTPVGAIDGPPSGPAAPWRATAAYFYTLDLDAAGLAWEYLRRDPAYRAAWRGERRAAPAMRWGLRCCRRS